MPPRPSSESVNLNSVLISIVILLSGWSLKKQTDQGEQMSALAVKVQNLERVVYATRPTP